MTPETDLMTESGRNYPVQSILTGRAEPFLQLLADEHAADMARERRQSHDGWNDRFSAVCKTFPGCAAHEVAAESWPENNRLEAASEMFHSWEQSPGHWSVVNGRADLFGYSMALGSNGVWYGCGICVVMRPGLKAVIFTLVPVTARLSDKLGRRAASL